MSYQKALSDGSLHNVERTDTLSMFVDGKVAAVRTGLEAGTNPVPQWG
ncbi:unnamed protein product, partial [Amoebophrya sp. A25]|eukprot:GSA25T00005673001.1